MRKVEYIFGIVIFVAALSIIIGMRLHEKETKAQHKQTINDFKSKYIKLEQELQRSKSERMAFIDSLNQLTLRRETADKQVDSLTLELKKIKNRYTRVPDSELAKLMERRAR